MSDTCKADASQNESNPKFAHSSAFAMAEKLAQIDRHLQPARQFASGIPRSLPVGIGGIASEFGNTSQRIAEITAPIQKIIKQIEGPIKALNANSELSRIIRDFQEQHDALNKIENYDFSSSIDPKSPDVVCPDLSAADFPLDPAYETNGHLERLNLEFEEVNKILKKQARSALKIQIFAAQYIEEFREASKETHRHSKIAIWLSFLAILASTIFPLGDLLHVQFHEKPSTQEFMHEELSKLNANLSAFLVTHESSTTRAGDNLVTLNPREENFIHGILSKYSKN